MKGTDIFRDPSFPSASLVIVFLIFILAEIATFFIAEGVVVILGLLFYIPILFVAVRYPERAIPVGLGLSIVYLFIALMLSGNLTNELFIPFMQFYVYVGISIMLASLVTRFRINETKYRELFRHSGNAICIVDTATHTIVEANPRFDELVKGRVCGRGITRLEEVLCGLDLLVSSPDRHREENSSVREVTLDTSSGIGQTFLVSTALMEEAGLAAVTLTNITEWKQAAQDIAAQTYRLSFINRIIALTGTADSEEGLLGEILKETLRVLHCESGCIYLVHGPSRTVRLAYAENLPAFCPGTSPDLSIETPPFPVVMAKNDLFTPATAGVFPERRLPEGLAVAGVVPIQSGNTVLGSLHIAGARQQPFSDDEKEILRAIGRQLGRALESMRTTGRLLREEENFRTLFNTIDDFVLILSFGGRIIAVNDAYVRKMGYSRPELIDCSIFDVCGKDVQDHIAALMNDPRVCGTGTCPITLTTKAGTPLEVECRMREGTWNGERVLFGIARDITERVHAEEMLRHRREILEAINYSADRFLKEPFQGSTWTHEIPAVLERLGKATSAGRVCIYQNLSCPDKEEDTCIGLKFEWTHPTRTPLLGTPALASIPFCRYHPDAFQYLSAGNVVRLPLDQLSFLSDDYATKNGRIPVVHIPIMADTHWWGILTLEPLSEDRTWSQIEVEALKTAAEMIGTAIHHRTMVEIYQNPVEHSTVGIFLLQDEIMTYVNPRFADIFGYIREELVGRPFVPLLIAPEDHALVEKHRSLKIPGLEESAHYNVNGVKKDKTRIVLEIYSKRVAYLGQPAVVGTIMDITERVRAQVALEESEDMFRTLSQVAPVGIFLVDRLGNCFFVNDQWCQITDLTLEEAAGKGWLGSIYPDDTEVAEGHWREFLEKGNEIASEHRIRRRDGSIVWVYFRALVRRNSDGVITGYVGTLVDITTRKMYEETLMASLNEKSVLIMEIHHRVKNNLQIISGLIKLQSREITNRQALDALHECETRVITMALVHESLYQSGNLANINARRHIMNLANTLVMSDDHEAHIDMEIDVDDMPLDMNTAVPASLIINELVINTLKHAFAGRANGKITISFHREPGDMLALTVSDDGVGMPPGLDISKIRSLGLKLVTRLVRDQLKGTVRIWSDHGTTFYMRFPVLPANSAAKRIEES